MPLTYGQLPNLMGQPTPHPFLYCPACGGEYSAHAGDYWQAEASKRPTCSNGHRARFLRLVRRECRLVEVTP